MVVLVGKDQEGRSCDFDLGYEEEGAAAAVSIVDDE